MKIITPSKSLLVLSLLIVTMFAEEWYMPDSNLINETQYQQKILNDHSTFKFVKYFTPHCIYCRYLKNVIDPLKHEKKWCFEIYDFNCHWYPQHCSQKVLSGSFPYTAILNAQGTLIDQLAGFYPEPVVRSIFDRIEAQCLQYKKSQQTQVPKSSLSQQEIHEIQIQPKQQEQNIQEKKVQQIKEDKRQGEIVENIKQVQQVKHNTQVGENRVNVAEPQRKDGGKQWRQQKQKAMRELKQVLRNEMREQVGKQVRDSVVKEVRDEVKRQVQIMRKQIQVKNNNQKQKVVVKQSQTHNTNTINQGHKEIPNKGSHEFQYFKYIFYGAALLIALYYFYSINNQQDPNNPQPNSQPISNQKQAHYFKQSGNGHKQTEEAEMLAQLPDQQL